MPDRSEEPWDEEPWDPRDLYDPDEWAAIEAGPSDAHVGAPPAAPLASRMVAWSRGSVLGMVITGAALGIQEVLEPRDQHAIVIEVDDDGQPHDLPIELFLDPDDPAGSLCIVRRDAPPPVV